MINVETVMFIEKLRDFAVRSTKGYIAWTSGQNPTDDQILYDDTYEDENGYPIITGDHEIGMLGTYDTEDSKFRVRIGNDGNPYILVTIMHSDDAFMINNGEWFSIT